MKKPDIFIIGILVLTFAIISGAALSLMRAGENELIKQYDLTDQHRPKIEISETAFDMGDMKVDDIKTNEITVKNLGAAPLIISDILTSCNCTFGQMIIEGIESPRFSMHDNFEWRGEIRPGGNAVLKITYEPRLMPVQGKVQRSVAFKTNDPLRSFITISFSAKVL